MANPVKSITQLADRDQNGMIGNQQDHVVDVVDDLDGATLTGDTLTTSATPTVDELEANDGVLGGKINEILAILEAHGLMDDGSS